jgi:hypothetical protein
LTDVIIEKVCVFNYIPLSRLYISGNEHEKTFLGSVYIVSAIVEQLLLLVLAFLHLRVGHKK